MVDEVAVVRSHRHPSSPSKQECNEEGKQTGQNRLVENCGFVAAKLRTYQN